MLKKVPLYPFLISLYPILALGAHNINQIAPVDILRPLLFSLLFAGVLFGLAYLVFRDWDRAALVSSLILLLFFSYGQVYTVLKGIALGDFMLFRHRTLGPIWMLLLVGGTYWAGWKATIRPSVTAWLNLLTALLLVYPVLAIGSYMVQSAAANSAARQASTMGGDQTSARPDIYYIILDGYARQDALKQETGLDNSDFINALKQRGFYVADCAQSNYAHTVISLASSLNYDYLENLKVHSIKSLPVLQKHGAARNFLESRGYTTVSFPTGYPWSEWSDADIYPSVPYQAALLTEFEDMVLSTSILRIPLDLGKLYIYSLSKNERYRQRVLSALELLKEVPGNSNPTFTFAHIVIPHHPYAFGPNGEPVDLMNDDLTDEMRVKGYRDQVIYIDREILKVVDAILSGSDAPPVIIIQGDHGAPVEFGEKALRLRILNAYYLPGGEASLYPSISPVNTFRVVFNTYFGAHLPLLEDQSYYSPFGSFFKLSGIPNSCPGQP